MTDHSSPSPKPGEPTIDSGNVWRCGYEWFSGGRGEGHHRCYTDADHTTAHRCICGVEAPATPDHSGEPKPTDRCAQCGFTYEGHIGNTGVLYPCWTPIASSLAPSGESISQPAINSSQSDSSGESSPPCPDCDALPDTVAPGEFGESSPPNAVWLIERGQRERQSPPLWLRADPVYYPSRDEWVEDANRATKFATREAALDAMRRRGHREDCGPNSVPKCEWGHIAEHVFLDPPTTLTTTGGDPTDPRPDPHARQHHRAPVTSGEESSPPGSSPEKPLLGTTHDPGRADGIVASHPLGGVEQVHASDGRPGLVGDGLPVVAEDAADEPAQLLDVGHGGKDNEEVEKLIAHFEDMLDRDTGGVLIAAARDALRDRFASLHQQLEEARKESAEAWAMADALDAKVKTLCSKQTCACSVDRPDDVCSYHSPQLPAALARAETAEKERDDANDTIALRDLDVARLVGRIRELEALLAEKQEDCKRCREARARIAELGVHPAPIRDDPIRDDRLTLALTLDVLTSEVRSALHEDAFARVYDIVYRALREDDAARSSPERPTT